MLKFFYTHLFYYFFGLKVLSVNVTNDRAEKKRKQIAHRKNQKDKRRLHYIQKLKEMGKPVGPPDEERWLPKNQRSYNKRGKKRNKYVGGQGVGSGGNKDANKLDMAQRIADNGEKRENSTAHLIAGGGGKSSKRMPRR